MPSDFQLIPTINPTEWIVALTVPDLEVNQALSLMPYGKKLEKYLPYNQFSWGGNLARTDEFGEYRYISNSKTTAGKTTFYFAKPRTEKEKNTPYRTYWDTHQYVWPPVLLDLYFISSTFSQNTYNGSTTENATRYLQRHRYVPATPANSIVLVEQFLSDTPWDQKQLLHPQPVPGEIDGTYVGLQVTFPKCLHRKVTLKELVPGAKIIYGAGMEGSDKLGTPKEQVFPATNFTDWAPFVFADDASVDDKGMFPRTKVTIYPPARTEPIQN